MECYYSTKVSKEIKWNNSFTAGSFSEELCYIQSTWFPIGLKDWLSTIPTFRPHYWAFLLHPHIHVSILINMLIKPSAQRSTGTPSESNKIRFTNLLQRGKACTVGTRRLPQQEAAGGLGLVLGDFNESWGSKHCSRLSAIRLQWHFAERVS